MRELSTVRKRVGRVGDEVKNMGLVIRQKGLSHLPSLLASGKLEGLAGLLFLCTMDMISLPRRVK